MSEEKPTADRLAGIFGRGLRGDRDDHGLGAESTGSAGVFGSPASVAPFATAWIARTRLASSPVVFYAGLFVCIDIAYNAFEREVLACAGASQVSEGTRRMARRRSLGVLASFTTAMLIAFVAPRLGFGIICGALILHLRPEAAPGVGLLHSLLDSTRAIVKDRVHRLRNRSRSDSTNR
jgi:hypothetical protein